MTAFEKGTYEVRGDGPTNKGQSDAKLCSSIAELRQLIRSIGSETGDVYRAEGGGDSTPFGRWTIHENGEMEFVRGTWLGDDD